MDNRFIKRRVVADEYPLSRTWLARRKSYQWPRHTMVGGKAVYDRYEIEAGLRGELAGEVPGAPVRGPLERKPPYKRRGRRTKAEEIAQRRSLMPQGIEAGEGGDQ